MELTQENEERLWHVLHFIRKPGAPAPQKHIDDFNRDGARLELFAPLIRPAHMVNGRVVYRDRLLTYHYVFVKGSLAEVKALCASPVNGFSMLLDRGSERRYATLSDEAMESFRIIARVHTNTVPFYSIDDIDLEEGDTVEVVDGPYAGLRGTFMPRARSRKGNLVIAATADMGAVVWDIDARYVRILEFARDTRRQYDILDSFIPRLLPVLRRFHAGERLPEKDKSLLNVFNRRMGAVRLDNHKAEAKLLATLMCVQTVTGDSKGYETSSARFGKRRKDLTNPWTEALTELMLSVADGDMPRLSRAYDELKDREGIKDLPEAPTTTTTAGGLKTPTATTTSGGVKTPTATQKLLLDEFRHYLP